MQEKGAVRQLYESIPVQAVKDGCVISRYADVTFGWEVTLPSLYSVMEDGYDDMVELFASAARILPPWTVMHRQDVYRMEEYHPEIREDEFIMRQWNKRHFDGTRYMTHHQYLYLTFSSKASVLRPNDQTAAFGFRFSAPLPKRQDLEQMARKAEEFASVLTSSGRLGLRRLEDEDYEGYGNVPGLIEQAVQLFDDGPVRSDIVVAPDRVNLFGKELMGFRLSESVDIPLEVSNVRKSEGYGSAVTMLLSSSAPLGTGLECEHTVNQFIVIPDQQAVMRDLAGKKNRMGSMRKSNDNRLNYEQIKEFEDMVITESKMVAYFHMNVLVWDYPDRMLDLRGKVSSALLTMGCMAVQAENDLPSLLFTSVPGGACEVGKDNYMLQALESVLLFGLNETFEESLEGGLFTLTDRYRHVPLTLDIQLLAQKKRWIDNFNFFLCAPSGAGKSFFTNLLLEQGYANGESIVVIDVGDSYEGLCQIINEESGGRDGIYLSWTPEHPFSFNPFQDIASWIENGHLVYDEGGVPFFMSFLQTAWQPVGGWTPDAVAILDHIILEFVKEYMAGDREELPIFDDFYRYLGEKVLPRIVPEYDKKGGIKALPKNPFMMAYRPVTPEDFDIGRFMRALVAYSAEGSYSFLLNERHPRDLFASRFTVFEVLKLSQGDKLFYSLCILCIMNAFDMKMHRSGGFKRLCVDEAWKAISNETMAPYLRGLWKCARKYQTSAMVITQEIDDIRSSEVIRDAILNNSDIRTLLNQSKYAERFDEIQSLMGLSAHQKNLVLSIKKGEYQAFISMPNHYSVYEIKASIEEGLIFESSKVAKAPLMARAKELGSLRRATEEFAARIRAEKRKK